MKMFCGIFLIVIGCIMLIYPKFIWEFTALWKTKFIAEPSDLYIILLRIGGCILIAGGVCTMA